ncbi:ScpA family protein [Thermoflexus sp.]|uniref:segregation and condensation protein A n=1 Tax=Thermoflexus sp. TaxID=1969742 RepID=UPI0025DB3F0F|nr:ScpA family protein [Thermoflexus sp.]MCS6963072.1 segregation/condensation protein A [Thermoflexus sp.]MCX7690607.1 segregation/condensation protein A [Thermoflexus sp.]MDW8184521.1 ScpA family protein [Anaerolineae bacterium]
MTAPFRPTLPPVRLPLFEGPLDLLLYLIERNDLDITQISLAQVTAQYLEYVTILQALTLDQLAEYLVIAAKLLYIKSSLLLPRPPEPDEQEEDMGEALVEQLKAYRLFRMLARQLAEREGFTAYGRTAPPPQPEAPGIGLEGVPLEALLRLARRALLAQPEALSVDRFLTPYRLTIHEAIERILEAVQHGQRVALSHLLREAETRYDLIALFLGLLELLKQRRVLARQSRLFDEIYIEPCP